jgi:hypothetical protein
MNTKFYIDTEGNDDNAYKMAMRFACQLAKEDAEIKKIVLYIHTKTNIGLFDRLFGTEIVKKLFSGYKFTNCPILFKFETKVTYKKSIQDNESDIVICCGMDSEDLFTLDNYYFVKYIIAIPWQRQLSDKWIKTWRAIEISGKGSEDDSFPEPSCIVKLAMQQLTDSINMSTGISHPMDNNRAKTIIRALHKYEPELNADIVGSYLVRVLNWDTSHANEIEKLIETLNNGRFFKGGEKTGLQNYYKRWKNECK